MVKRNRRKEVYGPGNRGIKKLKWRDFIPATSLVPGLRELPEQPLTYFRIFYYLNYIFWTLVA
jgi:hypothetical protein